MAEELPLETHREILAQAADAILYADAAAILRDVTALWEREQELNRNLRELSADSEGAKPA